MPGPKIKNGKRKRPSGKSSRPPDGQIRPSSRRQKGPGTRKKVAPEPSGQLLACFQVLEGIADPALIYDLRGTVVRANTAAKESFGFNPAGMSQTALVKKLSSRAARGVKLKRDDFISARALTGKAVRDREYRFTDAKGKKRTVLSSAAPIKEGREIDGALVVWHDVTEQRRAQQEAEDLSRFPSENPNPVLRSDRSGTILYSNPAAAKAFGRSRCGIGRPLPAELFRMAREAEKTGLIVQGEVRGKKRIFQAAAVPVKGNDYVNIYCLDITERKQAEEHLHRERSLLEIVMRTTDVMLVLLDSKFNFVWVNPAYAETCRMKPEELIGKNHFTLYPDPENEAIFRKVLKSGKGVFHKDRPFVFPDQPERGVTYWDWSLTPVKDHGGRVTGLVFSLRETTKYKQALEALRESEERLRLAQVSAGAGVWDWDITTGKLEWSHELFSLFALDPASSVPGFDLWRSVIHPDDRARAQERIETAIKNHSPHSSEYRIVLASGKVRWINALGDTTYDRNGRPTRMSGICINITARKKLENLLEANLTEQQTILDSSPVLIFFKDKGNRFLRVNKAFEKVMNISRSEMEGKSMFDLYPSRQAAAYGKDDREVMKSGREKLGIIETLATPQGVRTIRIDKVPYFDENGEIKGVIGFGVDITDIRQTEEALRESEQRLKKAQGMAHLGSWELDLAAGALTWSDEVYHIFGLQPGEFGATYEAFLEMVHPEDRETVDAAYADSIRGGKNGYEIEHRVIRKGTGEVRIVHEKCEHLRDGSGKIVRSVGMVHDITEMKNTEQALEELNSSLEQTIIQRTQELISAHMELERAKRLSSIGTLAATVAHELRTPLGTIGLAAANLGRKAGNPALAGYIEKIQRKVVESNRIISNLLTYTGLRLPRPEIVRLDRIVTEALKTVREKFPRMRIRVTKDLAALAKITLAADEVQLLEIFNNLLANAYQAIGSREGLIEVTGRIENDAAAVITIRDNGKGIDEEEMERVFEPFYSGKKTGTGLGLPLSKELAELHGGSIKIVSAKEKGTAVTVTIPLHRDV